MKRRQRSHEVCLFVPDGTNGMRFLRRVSIAKGDELVLARKAIRFDSNETGECLGYELLHPEPARCGIVTRVLPMLDAMSCTFTRLEVEMLAGLQGESRTERVRESWKKQGFRFDPDKMDQVEEARVKQRIYHTVH